MVFIARGLWSTTAVVEPTVLCFLAYCCRPDGFNLTAIVECARVATAAECARVVSAAVTAATVTDRYVIAATVTASRKRPCSNLVVIYI